jgi:SAM-dependent methyltransferase
MFTLMIRKDHSITSENIVTAEQWERSSQGRAVLEAESALVREALEDCFGWETLQVGPWGAGRALLEGARTRSRTWVVPTATALADVVGRLTQLPFASDALDAVILPHTLEYDSDPHGVLREVDRVLAPEGKLIILGFAPLSPWGLRSMASRAGFPPGLRRLVSARRLSDWLRLLGHDVIDQRRYLYELPWGEPVTASARMRRGWFYPLPAGGFLLKAKKRVHALTPLRPRLLAQRPRVLGGLTEPSSVNRAPVNETTVNGAPVNRRKSS